MFEMEGVKLRFQEEALHSISRRAIQRRTGARGLRSIMEGILLETMFELPTLNGVQEVVITADVVDGKVASALHLFGQGPGARANAPPEASSAQRFRRKRKFLAAFSLEAELGACGAMLS